MTERRHEVTEQDSATIIILKHYKDDNAFSVSFDAMTDFYREQNDDDLTIGSPNRARMHVAKAILLRIREVVSINFGIEMEEPSGLMGLYFPVVTSFEEMEKIINNSVDLYTKAEEKGSYKEFTLSMRDLAEAAKALTGSPSVLVVGTDAVLEGKDAQRLKIDLNKAGGSEKLARVSEGKLFVDLNEMQKDIVRDKLVAWHQQKSQSDGPSR